jgi:hypothetical protein
MHVPVKVNDQWISINPGDRLDLNFGIGYVN